jgi:hypothetical protein
LRRDSDTDREHTDHELTDREWRKLVETVGRGNCVLVLGTDIAVPPDDPSAPPLTSQLAARLAQGLSVADPHDLPLVAHTYVHSQNRDRLDLEFEVQDFYAPYDGKITPAHRDLAALPFSLCLTTSPDGFLAEAFRRTGTKEPITAHYDMSAPGRKPTLPEGTPERPIVYSLFGALEHLPSLVLSETDLLRYLDSTSRSASGLPDSIAAQLSDRQTAFLFLGFGFQRWYTRILLYVLNTYEHSTRSLAIEGEGFFAHPEVERTTLFFEQAGSIAFKCEDWSAFAATLRERYEATAPSVPAQPAADLTGAPKVFLCHDSRDGELVDALGRQLNALGVATWRDAQNLRGGMNWDRQIQQVLNKQVDYVLVCETPGMVSKGRSYFHKEIAVALEVQKEFPLGQTFVWPATLQPGAQFEQLDDLHRVDVSTETGVQTLADQLLEDWAARPRERGSAA